MTPQTFLFLGISGCGKGTQRELLEQVIAERDPLRRRFTLSTGSTLRALAQRKTLTGRTTSRLMEGGELAPIFLAIWNWGQAFIEGLEGDEHIFIDGAPRMYPEAQAFHSAFEFYERSMPTIILITISKSEAKRRLLARGRRDDDVAAIEHRLGWYEKHVVPAIDYFRDKPQYRFIEVDGEASPDTVHRRILSELEFA